MYCVNQKNIALWALMASIGLAVPALAQDRDDVTELETVVVESSKSNQTYLDSNSSVQVVPAQKLEEAEVTTVQGLTKLVPGLVAEPRGNRTYAGYTLRGISSANYFSPALSVYVDGVLQDSAFAMQELTNVKSVEVLKGPQGTLFGGNSHGGIINVVTYKGSDDPYGQVNLSVDQLTQRANAVLSTPIGGSGFGADLSLFYEDVKGEFDNTETGKDKANGSLQKAGTIGFYYRPKSGPFSASLKYKIDDLDSGEEFYITEREFKDKKTNRDNFFVSTDPKLDRDLRSATLATKYEVSDNLAIEAVLGSQTRTSDRDIVGGSFDEAMDKVTQELRLSTTSSQGAQYVLGLYHERSEWRYDSRSPFAGGLFIRKNRVVTENFAVFADANIPLTPVLDMSAGVRYGVDESDIDFIAGFPGGDFVQNRKDNIFLPKLGLGLKLSDNTKLFATASAGYRPSGYNFIPSGPAENAGFDSEISRNYELGIKTANKGFAFNAALYYIQLEDVQVYAGQMPNQILRNLGNAESKGIEMDTTYAFNADRTTNVTFGLNWGNGQYTSGNEEFGFTDKKLQYSPETTANLAFQAKVADEGMPGKVLVGGSGRFRSKFYFDEANSLSQGDHTIIDAHVKYVTRDGSSVQLFGKNLTDVEYATYKFGGFGPTAAALGTWAHGMTVGVAGTLLF